MHLHRVQNRASAASQHAPQRLFPAPNHPRAAQSDLPGTRKTSSDIACLAFDA
jgi:hypothetical protein